jgi:hypothetical protein
MKSTVKHAINLAARPLRLALASALCACAVSTAWAQRNYATARALRVGSSSTVRLVDDGDGWGVYYFKVNMQMGRSYTFWTTGIDPEAELLVDDMTAEILYTGWEDTDWVGEMNNERDGANMRLFVTQDDWDTEERLRYSYLVLYGDVGASVTVNSSAGIVPEAIPPGDPENPAAFSVATTAPGLANGRLMDGSYWFRVSLTAGNKYKFATVGGTEDNELDLGITAVSPAEDGAGDHREEPVVSELLDPAWVDDFNPGILVVPQSTGLHFIEVTAMEDAAFFLKHQAVQARPPKDHPSTPLPIGGSLPCQPGYCNEPASGYFDQVIDQQLFKVTLQRDGRYVFETTDLEGEAALVMRLYDAAGNILYSNTSKAPGDRNTLIAFQAPANGDYWVGVSQDIENEDEEEPKPDVQCRVNARLLTAGEGLTDDWDPNDDVVAGANGLVVPPVAGPEVDPLDVDEGHGPHTLGVNDWADIFGIAARRGVTYRLKTSLPEEADERVLSAQVFTLTGAREMLVATIDDLSVGGDFTATAHGMYYVRVYLANGQGLDYGPYLLHACAYQQGAALGILQVNIMGPTAANGASWSLVSDGFAAPKYDGGMSVLLAAGAQTVRFASVAGWSTPANRQVVVGAGNEPTVVTVKYNDTSDPRDDAPVGAVVINPTSREQTLSRSLWAEDPGDWFRMSVRSGTYYNLRLELCSGAPWIRVYRTITAEAENVVAEGTECLFLARETATYYVQVGHQDPAFPTDSAYTLRHNSVTVGDVKLDRNAYRFREDAAKADFRVMRTGREGRVRVRYTTRAGTAVPGINYMPVSGVLEWPAGNSAVQTVSVPLIPNLLPKWNGDTFFSIEIAPMPADELEGDEWVPSMAQPSTAVVTLTEVSAIVPGTLAFSGFGDVFSEPFENAWRPAVTVAAGDPCTLWIERTVGSEGPVAVTVSTQRGSALDDQHFIGKTEQLFWADGDMTAKPFVLQTLQTGEAFMAAKNMTVRMAVDRTAGGAARLGTSSVAVTIQDPDLAQTVEAWSAGMGRTGPFTVRAVPVGSWYFDRNGFCRSTPVAARQRAEISFTLTGPGRLAFVPGLIKGGDDDNSTMTATIGREVIPCENGDEIVRYLGRGSHVVRVTVMRGMTSPADAEVYGYLNPYGEQMPILWEPLAAATDPDPANPRGVVYLGGGAEGNALLQWRGDSEARYRVYVDLLRNKVGTPDAEFVAVVDGLSFDTASVVNGGLAAGKTYFWRVDTVLADDEGNDLLVNTNTVWSFLTAAADAAATIVTGPDGTEIAGGTTLDLQQGLATEFQLGHTGGAAGFVSYMLAGGRLPDGLRLTANTGVISGTPTRAGEFSAVFQVRTGWVSGSTVTLNFRVLPIQLAAGTFNGLLETSDEVPGIHYALASINMVVAENGRITARATVAGRPYTFAGTGYTEDIELLDNGQPGLRAVLTTPVRSGFEWYTNTLTVTVCRGPDTDEEALDTIATAELVLNHVLPGNPVVQSTYFGDMVRDNSRVPLVQPGIQDLAGYYTVSLPNEEASDGEPQGAGYLTITINANGTARLAGVLGDGTAVSASVAPGYVSNYEEHLGGVQPALLLPVYVARQAMAIGGWLLIMREEDDPAGQPIVTGELYWVNDDPNATRDGEEGYAWTVEAVGGFYNTLLNLQTYYLNQSLTVGDMTFDGLPEQLDATYTKLLYWPGFDEAIPLTLVGSSFAQERRVLARDVNNARLNDFEASVNPCNLNVNLNRNTGIFQGNFGLWYGNDLGTLQREQAGIRIQGVMTPVKPSGSAYFDMPGMGLYQISERIERRTWMGSYWFKIMAEDVEHDWSEGWDN